MGVMTQEKFDPELVKAANAGQPGARDQLLDQWLPVVLGWCIRLGGPKVDAEDACHDVFLVVLNRLGALKDPVSFPSWLFGVTRRVLARHRRQAWVKRWLPAAVPERPDEAPLPSRNAEMSEAARLVWAALDTLPPPQREVLLLCDLEERTDAEVALLLDIPLGTVKSRLRLARARFKTAVAHNDADEAKPALQQRGGG